MIGVCCEGHEQISYMTEECPLCQVLKAMAELILIIDKGKNNANVSKDS